MVQPFPRASSQAEEERRRDRQHVSTSLSGSDTSLGHIPLMRTSHLRTHGDFRELRNAASGWQPLSSNNSVLWTVEDTHEYLGRQFAFSDIGSFHSMYIQGKKLSCPKWREAGKEYSVFSESQAEAC